MIVGSHEGSAYWDIYSRILDYYSIRLAARYLLSTTVVRRTMMPDTPVQFARFASTEQQKVKQRFLNTRLESRVERVIAAVCGSFHSVDEELLAPWLWSYCWPFHAFAENVTEEELRTAVPVELGAGTGLSGLILGGITQHDRLVIFDLPAAHRLQESVYRTVARSGLPVPRVERATTPQQVASYLDGAPYYVVSNWAFTEFPVALRQEFEPLLQRSRFAVFSSNSRFAEINNRTYFTQLSQRLTGRSFHYRDLEWHFLKGHFALLVK